MSDAFDTLERDLRRAVRARRRRRLPSAPVLALIAALALGGGGAVAATRIARDPGVEREAQRVFLDVVKDTSRAPECAAATIAAPPVFADLPLAPEIAETLPALATPVPGERPERVAPLLRRVTGTVLRQTVRTLEFPGGIRMDVFVMDSARSEERDPAGCIRARRARAAELADGDVLAAVDRRIEAAPSFRSGLQMLHMAMSVPGEPGPTLRGFVAEPGRPLRTGIIDRADLPGGFRRYQGIARPGVARVRVDPAHGRTRTVVVLQGFYIFGLPRGSGQARVTELAADGARIRSFRLPR